MAGTLSNHRPVFSKKPKLFSGFVNSVGICTINSGTPSNQYEICTCDTSAGWILDRLKVVLSAEPSETTSDMIFYLCVYNPDLSSWYVYDTVEVNSVTVSQTVSPPKFEYIFSGGLILPESWRFGISRSYDSGNSYDNFYFTLEGGNLEDT